MQVPSVTVVLTADRAFAYEHTLACLRAQKLTDFECLLLYRAGQQPPRTAVADPRVRPLPCRDAYSDAVMQSRAPYLVFLRSGDEVFDTCLQTLVRRADSTQAALTLFGAWKKTADGHSHAPLPYDGVLLGNCREERLIGALCGRRERRYPSLVGCEEQLMFQTQLLRSSLSLFPADRAFLLRAALGALLQGERVLCVSDCLLVQMRPVRSIARADRLRILNACRNALQKNASAQAESLFASLANPATV